MSEKRLDIYVCTRSKCTAKQVALCVRTGEAQHDYNGPALLAALTRLVHDKGIGDRVTVHEATCMSGCPVGPRLDLCSGSQRVMYFRRLTPTGRVDLITWTSIKSVESEIETHLSEQAKEIIHAIHAESPPRQTSEHVEQRVLWRVA